MLAVLLLCLEPISLAWAKSSTDLGITNSYSSDEINLETSIAGLVYSYSLVANYTCDNEYDSTTTSIIYSAASGEGNSYSIAFYDGEGYYSTVSGHTHWYIEDMYEDPVYDRNIFANCNGNVRFALLWACDSGDTLGGTYSDNTEYGMPPAWLLDFNLSNDGYKHPDSSGRDFIGFNQSAPRLENPYWTNTGTSYDPGFVFLKAFYLATLCFGFSVNKALDYAALEVWEAPSFGQSIAYQGMTDLYGNYYQMKVYGDGNLVLSNATIVCGMKTLANGYFYVPNATISFLKVEFWYDGTLPAPDCLVGDQYGATSPYPAIKEYPDQRVDGKDISFVAGKFGDDENMSGWDYMADVNADGVIDGKDIADVAIHFGNGYNGCYDYNVAGLVINFNNGDSISVDANGIVSIPTGATSFNVTRNGSQVAAMVIFGEAGS